MAPPNVPLDDPLLTAITNLTWTAGSSRFELRRDAGALLKVLHEKVYAPYRVYLLHGGEERLAPIWDVVEQMTERLGLESVQREEDSVKITVLEAGDADQKAAEAEAAALKQQEQTRSQTFKQNRDAVKQMWEKNAARQASASSSSAATSSTATERARAAFGLDSKTQVQTQLPRQPKSKDVAEMTNRELLLKVLQETERQGRRLTDLAQTQSEMSEVQIRHTFALDRIETRGEDTGQKVELAGGMTEVVRDSVLRHDSLLDMKRQDLPKAAQQKLASMTKHAIANGFLSPITLLKKSCCHLTYVFVTGTLKWPVYILSCMLVIGGTIWVYDRVPVEIRDPVMDWVVWVPRTVSHVMNALTQNAWETRIVKPITNFTCYLVECEEQSWAQWAWRGINSGFSGASTFMSALATTATTPSPAQWTSAANALSAPTAANWGA